MDFVVVGGGPWSPDTNFPTHHTARLLSRDHRVLYLCRSTHTSLLGRAAGRLPTFHSWSDLSSHVLSRQVLEQVDERLWVSSLSGFAAALPLSYPPALRAISARLVILQLRTALMRLRFDDPILWFYWWFFPEIARSIPHALAAYDIYDEHSEYDYVRSNPRRQSYTRTIERDLLRNVDLAFAVSQALVRDKSGDAPVYYLPNGVDISLASSARAASPPRDIVNLPRPIVGYLGSYDSRLDWALVDTLAEARPSWSFVFVGGGTTEPRRPRPNLHLLGNRPYPEALRYVNQFDIALIPFVRDALTEAVCPAKLFDYLALGKPIISTPIPAVTEVAGGEPLVYRGSTGEEFIRLAERALREDRGHAAARRGLANTLTWEHRTETALDRILDVLRGKGAAA